MSEELAIASVLTQMVSTISPGIWLLSNNNFAPAANSLLLAGPKVTTASTCPFL
ncbi:hypothetical protein [Dolichospermum sp. UHCC 0259]|uniref:hypothetical protein n=1 Tax=Dolichospermum sp. UHCC 0259 TaxID=2590010 RepID=UPI001C2DA8A7|nr:hypothetical protein [Dolichospermum sp. UHCC 0259]